ncbi:hypothetical protein QT972_09680 [Microcoleus sp. herbarium7]|uniref:hypothetical protein n=1 Tax=Microcoleus sp. herbarium7 TaxID=3055435 RepID=UPI002FD0FB16
MSVDQSAVTSMVQAVGAAISYIQSLKGRLLARKATILAREATIVEYAATISARDLTIVERNAENAAYLTLVEDLRAQVLDLGGDLASTEALYQEQLLLKDAALAERALSEQARIASEAARQAIVEEQAIALAAEVEEDRLDALRLAELAAALQALSQEASDGTQDLS